MPVSMECVASDRHPWFPTACQYSARSCGVEPPVLLSHKADAIDYLFRQGQILIALIGIVLREIDEAEKGIKFTGEFRGERLLTDGHLIRRAGLVEWAHDDRVRHLAPSLQIDGAAVWLVVGHLQYF